MEREQEFLMRGKQEGIPQGNLALTVSRRAILLAVNALFGIGLAHITDKTIGQAQRELTHLAQDHFSRRTINMLKDFAPFIRSSYHEYQQYTEGANDLSDREYEELFVEGSLHAVALEIVRTESESPDGIYDVHVGMDKPQVLVARLNGKTDELISAPVIEVEFNGKRKKQPIIRSWVNDEAFIFLGKAKAEDDYVIHLSHTDSSDGISEDNLDIDVYGLTSDNPIHRVLLLAIPEVGVLPENLDPRVVIQTDALYRSFGRVKRYPDGVLIAEYWSELFGEPGRRHPKGGKDPRLLWDEYRRTYDVEIHRMVKFLPDGRIIEVVHQDAGHTIVSDMVFTDPLFVEEISFQPLQLIPAHGMVKTVQNVEHVFTPFTDFQRGDPDGKIADLHIASQVISFRQHLKRGSLKKTDKPIVEFVCNFLDGNEELVTAEEAWYRTYRPRSTP